jgi:hypothetical protein
MVTCRVKEEQKIGGYCFINIILGATARDVLLNSNLPPNRLERIW